MTIMKFVGTGCGSGSRYDVYRDGQYFGTQQPSCPDVAAFFKQAYPGAEIWLNNTLISGSTGTGTGTGTTAVSNISGARRYDGGFDVQWSQAAAGTVVIKLDGTTISQKSYTVGQHYETIPRVPTTAYTLDLNGVLFQVARASWDEIPEVTVRKELVTNLTSNETLVKAALLSKTNMGVEGITFVTKYTEGNNTVFVFDIKNKEMYDVIKLGSGFAEFINANLKIIVPLLAGMTVFGMVWIWRDSITKQQETISQVSQDTRVNIERVLSDTALTVPAKTEAIKLIMAGQTKSIDASITATKSSTGNIVTLAAIGIAAYVVIQLIRK